MYINVAQATCVFVLVFSAHCDAAISEEDYDTLPPIFHIDDYGKCLQENKEFCKIKIDLLPVDKRNPSEAWKLIEKTKKSKRHYNHNKLHHAICADNYYADFHSINRSDVEQIFSKIYSDMYKHLGLKAKISSVDCKNYDNSFKITLYDTVLMTFILSYLFFIAIATLYDVKTRKKSKCNKYVVIFSVRHNLSKYLKSYQNMNSGKLKCIQGFRFYTTLLIIFCHTFGSFIGGYVYNTDYLEDFPENPFRNALRALFVFLVQTFFLVSGWLLSYHTFQFFAKNNKQFDATKFAVLTFLNRYLRIIPPLLFMIALGRSVWIYGIFHGPVKEIYADAEYRRCQNNWWINLLLLNNHYKKYDMCYFITWYLSADTQLYGLSIIILIAIWKYPRHLKSIFGLSLAVSILVPVVVNYVNGLDIIYRITPENSKYNMFFSFEFNATYSSTYCNMATYILGLIFGYIYYKYEDIPLFNTKFRRYLWRMPFVTLPLSTLFISSQEFTGISAALIGALLKPLFSFGIAIGILGMSQQIGGIAKKIFEWKPAIFLGNITYSTYVVQFGIVFYRTAVAKQPLFVSDFILIQSFIRDAIYSFLCGFFMHVLLEMPALQLQNMLVPRIRTHQP